MLRCRPSSLRPFALSAIRHSHRLPSNVHIARDKKHARLLRIVEKRIEERGQLLSEISEERSSPDDISRLKQLKESEPLQAAWDKWIQTCQLLDETEVLLKDEDDTMRTLAAEEHESLSKAAFEFIESTFPALLIPASTTSHLSALMELKSAVGGSDSKLFLADLLRMYLRLANGRRWKAQVVAQTDADSGGIKDALVEIKGVGAYDSLHWESGVHRVQRIPITDAAGRVHTSTIAVIVLPLIEDTDLQKEDLFSMEDVKVEVMRARGAGGQHVNKTESAVRLTHIPSGITVSIQDERSQHQNKRRAFQILRGRLLDQKIIRDRAEKRATRQSVVRTADRSEKIRTYNYVQERLTDHRIGLTLTNLSSVLEGEGLEDVHSALRRDQYETMMEDMFQLA